jgi:hypothetical protein
VVTPLPGPGGVDWLGRARTTWSRPGSCLADLLTGSTPERVRQPDGGPDSTPGELSMERIQTTACNISRYDLKRKGTLLDPICSLYRMPPVANVIDADCEVRRGRAWGAGERKL